MTDTPRRILEAARRRIAAHGMGGVSLQEIADDAGVSKALLLYHFGDKDALLAHLADRLSAGLAARERESLDTAEGSGAIDALWRWLQGELELGELRVLLTMASDDAVPVREAVARGATRRREAATHTVTRLFALLGLRPRVAPPLVADVAIAFADGLALDPEQPPSSAQRVRFDVFWLAMLSLAE